MRMKQLFIAVCVLFALGATAQEKVSYPPIVKNKELYATNDLRAQQAPELEFGKVVSGTMPELKGKVLLLDFWATWCGPCRKVMPELDKWQKQFKDDLVVIGISDEEASTVSEFIAKNKVDYVITTDPEKKMSKFIGIAGIPHVLIITPDNVVRWQGFPGSKEDPLTADKIKQIIDAYKASN